MDILKKIFIFFLVAISISGIALFANAAHEGLCEADSKWCLFVRAKISDPLCSLILEEPEITGVEFTDRTTTFKTNYTSDDYQAIDRLVEQMEHLEDKFRQWEADKVDAINGTYLPYACPRDIQTGEVVGLYLSGGSLYTQVNDSWCGSIV